MHLPWIQTAQIVFRDLCRGHDSATGFPVRSHHLSGLSVGTAVKGELLHLNIEEIVGFQRAKVK